jgi:hypothetical protein
MAPGQRTPSPRPFTRDDWQRVEAILTQATRLSDADGKALIDGAALDDPLRSEAIDLLHLSGPESGLVETRSAPVRGTPPGLPAAGGFKPGDTLEGGRFVIVQQIGRGGMGAVYLAQDTVLGTLVALKIVPADERLLQEAQRAAACSGHEHVATVHNVLLGEQAGKRTGVLVMEYVAGRPANRILDDGPVGADRAIKWVRQAALAVAHAHDSEVLHCDLKPGNMIVTPDGRIKVLDFGIARRSFDRQNPAEPTYGTLPYMAPEQLLAGECSRASDIYSLGVTLFELVTGRLPFTGDSRMIKMQILAAPPPAVSGIAHHAPKGLDAVIERALAKDPAARFRSARAFAQALEDLTVTAAAVPAPNPPPAYARWIGTALAGLAALLALAWTFGLVASRSFEVFLHVDAEFTASFSDYFRVGREALLPFVSLWVIAGAGTAAIAGLLLFVRWRAATAWHAWNNWWHRLNAQALAIAALLSGVAALAGLVWTHRDVFDALVALHQRPAEAATGALSFSARPRHLAFSTGCAVLSYFLAFAALAWFPSLRRRSSQPTTIQRLRWSMLLLALVVMLAPTMPRRFLFERFRVAEHNGQQALMIGNAGDHVLLYDSARRVTLRVRRDAAGLRITDTTRQIFQD